MTNYALVIGLNWYKHQSWCLNGAVNDALRFAGWALNSGDVAPDRIKLLLSPTIDGEQVVIPDTQVTLSAVQATRKALRSVLYDDFKDAQWGKDGDRLYVYYAGHGCSHPGVRGEKHAEPVLILPDVERLPRDSDLLFTFSDILDVLRGCPPKEQFFFLDACQDFALDGIVASGGIGGGRYIRPIQLKDGTRAARQFVLYATSPGGKAIETRGKGVFGAVLLRGLKGDPGAARRLAGANCYELRFSDLFQFVQEEVQRRVADIPQAVLSIQIPEQDPEPSSPDPLIRQFDSEEIQEVRLTVRLAPGTALPEAKLSVFYDTFQVGSPFGPPLDPEHHIYLKPAYYSIEATAPNFVRERTRPFHLPALKLLDLTLVATAPNSEPAKETAPSPVLILRLRDQMTAIAVTGPGDFRETGQGQVSIPNAAPGLYHVRIMTPDGVVGDQVFEFPYCSSVVNLEPPEHKIGAAQLLDLKERGIAPSEGYLQPSEALGELAGSAPASLLGFAAYATYTLDQTWGYHLRAFGLQQIAESEERGKAWVSVLVSVEMTGQERTTFLERTSVILYPGPIHTGSLEVLPGYQAAGQYLETVPEANYTIEVRLPGHSPLRFPITCFTGRVATLCLNLALSGAIQMQIYLVPFDWAIMPPDMVRVLEQAQRFYSGSEPMPAVLTERLLTYKALDPLLGCVAGYTMIRSGNADGFRGKPNPAMVAPGWNDRSPLQNMQMQFDLLPDTHVLAGLCDPANRERHFTAAIERGLPLFSEGLRVLVDFFGDRAGQAGARLTQANRTLVTGSAFSAWYGYEPALTIADGRMEAAPVPWLLLEDERSRIEERAKAVGALRIQEAGGSVTFRTAFLVAPKLIVTAAHVLSSLLQPSVKTTSPPMLRKGTRVSFVLADHIEKSGEEFLVDALESYDANTRIAVLRLEQEVKDVAPLQITPVGPSHPKGDKVYLVGYPFLNTTLSSELLKHVFGLDLGRKRVQPGYIVAAPEDKPNFDHDAFTLRGSAGSPVIDLVSGLVLGVHWGGMDQLDARRGRAVAFWKPQNNLNR